VFLLVWMREFVCGCMSLGAVPYAWKNRWRSVYIYTCMYISICMCMRGYIIYIYMGVFVNVYPCAVSVYVQLYYMCLVACYSVTDSLVRFKLGNRRFGFVLVIDPIHSRFEDRPMRWFGGSYRFVQWKSYSDLDPKSRHFMWVFVLIFSFIYYYLQMLVYMFILFHVIVWYIYQYDHPCHSMWFQWVYNLSIQFIWTLISVISCDSWSPLLIQDCLWYTVDCDLIRFIDKLA